MKTPDPRPPCDTPLCSDRASIIFSDKKVLCAHCAAIRQFGV